MPSFFFWALALLIALAPLPFASNRLWSWSLAALCAGLLAIAWAWHESRYPSGRPIPARRHAPATLAFLLAIAWAFIQTASGLPDTWAHPLWAVTAGVFGELSPHAAISLDPGASLDGAMRLLTYGTVFWLALQLCRDARRAQQLLWVIALSGAVYAVYGLIVEFSGLKAILWYRKWAYEDALTATFVNRNSFATYAGMVALTILALLAHEIERVRPQSDRVLLRYIDALDALRGRAYLLIGCLLVVGSALFMTESRAGLASAAVGLAVFLAALGIYRRRHYGRVAIFAGFTLVAALLLAGISGGGVYTRLSSVADSLQHRTTVWAMTREATVQRPYAGTGLGTFDDIYLAQRDERLPPATSPFLRAHNTYLENGLELGLPAFILLVAALGWLGLWCARGVTTRRRHGIYPCVALGALTVGAVHAMFDFSLQIPAVTLCLVALLGAGCAQSNSSAED